MNSLLQVLPFREVTWLHSSGVIRCMVSGAARQFIQRLETRVLLLEPCYVLELERGLDGGELVAPPAWQTKKEAFSW